MSTKGGKVWEGTSPGGPGRVSGKGEGLNTQPYINPSLLSTARPRERPVGEGGDREGVGRRRKQRLGTGSWGDKQHGAQAQGHFG